MYYTGDAKILKNAVLGERTSCNTTDHFQLVEVGVKNFAENDKQKHTNYEK